MNLYIDFDGVILDTVRLYMDILNEFKAFTEEERVEILSNLSWDAIVEEAEIINDSIANIKKIIDSKIFNVSVLTHVNSVNEGLCKKKFMINNGINIEVIPVTKPLPKSSAVNPVNSILIDDDIENIIDFEEHGGTGIYFSNNADNYPVTSITSLDQILEVYNENIAVK